MSVPESTAPGLRIVSSDHSLTRYPCGVAAGDRLRLKEPLHLVNDRGSRVGAIIGTRSIWTVLAGIPSDPSVIWFEDPRGEIHTWDAASLWEDFRAEDGPEAEM